MEFKKRSTHWQRSQAGAEYERERIAILTGPLPKNDPALFTPTRCRVIRGFCISGKPVVIGEIVTIPLHLANDMQAIGKVELVIK